LKLESLRSKNEIMELMRERDRFREDMESTTLRTQREVVNLKHTKVSLEGAMDDLERKLADAKREWDHHLARVRELIVSLNMLKNEADVLKVRSFYHEACFIMYMCLRSSLICVVTYFLRGWIYELKAGDVVPKVVKRRVQEELF